MFQGGHFISNDTGLWIELAIFVLLFGGTLFLLYKVLRRKVPFWVSAIGLLLSLLSWFFGLGSLWIAALIVTTGLITTFLVINQADLRPFVVNTLSLKSRRNTEKVFDRHALYLKVFQACEHLSKSKIGAIITLERNTK